MDRCMGHASAVATMVAKAAGTKTQGVHELTDILTEEVSLVDLAANQRKFLVVKRSNDMGQEVTSNGKGGFTTAAKNGEPTPVAKALEVPPGYKEMVSPILAKATEKLGVLSKDLTSSKVADLDDEGNVPGIPAEFSTGLTGVIALLDRANNLFPVAPPEVEAGPAEGDEEAPTELAMRAAFDNLAKVLGNTKIDKSAVAKVGAKMSKDRLTRFNQAITVLQSLVGELAGDQGGAAAAPQKAQKGLVTEEQVAALVTEMTATNKQLVDTVRAQQTELAELKKSRGGSNSTTVESPAPIAKSESERVVWPVNLNAKSYAD